MNIGKSHCYLQCVEIDRHLNVAVCDGGGLFLNFQQEIYMFVRKLFYIANEGEERILKCISILSPFNQHCFLFGRLTDDL